MTPTRATILLVAAIAVIGAIAVAQEPPPPPEPPVPVAAESEEGVGEPVLPTVDELMDHLNNLYRAESSHAEITMDVVTENWSRSLEMESWSQGEDLALIVIRSPAREADTATLKTEDGLWTYAPRAGRLMRIPGGMMSEGWMGSHFTNEDIMRESDYVDDYETTVEWHDEEGTRYIKTISVPLPSAAVVYTRIEYLMTVDGWTPVRTDFYDGDELMRTFLYRDVRDINGTPVPFDLEIVPHDQPGESTRVQYETLELDVEVDRGMFTPQRLERASQIR